MSKCFLKVSLSDIELYQGSKFEKNDVVCIVFLNGNCIDKLYFKYKDYQSNLSLANVIEKVQLVFQGKDTGELIGCISFSSDIFIPFKGKGFTQWFTLFDSIEDDEFDGYIGEHDEDVPRALLSFRVEISNPSMPQINTAPSSQLVDNDKDNFLYQNVMSTCSNMSSKNLNRKLSLMNSSILGSEDPGLREETLNDSEKSGGMSSKKLGSLSLTYNGTSISQDFSNNRKLMKTQSWQKDFQPLDKIPTQQISLTEVRKIASQGEVPTQAHSEDEIHLGNLDGRMSDLLTMLQNQEKLDSKLQKKEENSINSSEFEEGRELLELEIKKSKMLEDSLKQAEIQLSKHEKLYEELEAKSKSQFKQLLETNKTLNEENYNLKQKIFNQETEICKNKESYTKEKNEICENFETRAENDRSLIEKYSITIQNLQKLNDDICLQLENTKSNLNQEKNLNKQLQNQMEEYITSNKDSFNSLKEKMQSYTEQIQILAEEKSSLELKISNYEMKVQTLEIKNKSLEAECTSYKKDLEKIANELQDFKGLTTNLKQSIGDIANQKDQEILGAKENISNLEEQIRKLRSQNEFLNAEKREIFEELSTLKQLDYESRINNIEDALNISEEARKRLQEQLQKSEARMQIFVQQQKERSQISKVYEDTIKEMREKTKHLILLNETMTNQLDQLKYENVDLKLKLDESGEVKEQNALLKDNINFLKEENRKLKDSSALLRQQLFSASTELVRQTSINLEQTHIIQDLTNQMQNLDYSLKVAFGDIKKMHFTLKAARRIEKPYDPYIPRVNDEIDRQISEFSNRAELPIKFIRMKPGVYAFGSKRTQVQLDSGRIFVNFEGNNYSIEDFVRIFGQQELFKMKDIQNNGQNIREIPYSNSDDGHRNNDDNYSAKDETSKRYQDQKLDKFDNKTEKSDSNNFDGFKVEESSSFSPNKINSRKRQKPNLNLEEANVISDRIPISINQDISPEKNEVA